ncbi:hypothetical protein GCM10009727_43970 [Actinomadura napierensis]|uniref:Uncharacterized protein n=1 Tax=Actinomadura napierensis TaxID=267854 RepID=A0ABN2ZM12_9ACTN
MIKVLVRDRHPVRGEQPIEVEVIVSGVLVPGPDKGPRWSEPRVCEQVERPGVDRHPRMSGKCDRRHVATVSHRPRERTRRNAQSGYAVGMKKMSQAELTILT